MYLLNSWPGKVHLAIKLILAGKPKESMVLQGYEKT